jgi:SAM-dependent methyltransferase
MSTDKKTLQWYNEHAQGYTEHVRNPDDSVYHAYYEKPAMYALMPDIRGKKVISLGCGSGEDSKHLKALGAAESVGIDLSPELIKIAKASYPQCDFQVMNMEQLNFPDSSFDFAYSSLALHYIEDWQKVFNEVFRILKPNSYFLFSCGHPVVMAMAMTENEDKHHLRQLAIVKDKIAKTNVVIGDYMNRHKLDSGLGSLGDVTTWHKSFSEIFNQAKQTGFVLDELVEPRPLPPMEQLSNRDYIRLNKIPEFVIFRFIKP